MTGLHVKFSKVLGMIQRRIEAPDCRGSYGLEQKSALSHVSIVDYHFELLASNYRFSRPKANVAHTVTLFAYVSGIETCT